MGKEEFKQAQKNFEYNAYKNPSIQTFNNLGVFYSDVGKYSWITKKYNVNYKLAKYYLKRANQFSVSYYTFSELGLLYLKQHNYTKASFSLTKALEIKQTSFVLNNLGVSKYYQKQYHDSSEYFYKAYVDYNNDEKFWILESYGISLAMDGNLEKAKEVLHILLNNFDKYEVNPDTFTLCYLCTEYNFILDNYENILEKFFISPENFKVISYSLKLLQQFDKAEELKRKLKHSLTNYELPKKIKQQYEQAFIKEKDENSNCIEINYHPMVLSQCNYYGCSNHNNDF